MSTKASSPIVKPQIFVKDGRPLRFCIARNLRDGSFGPTLITLIQSHGGQVTDDDKEQGVIRLTDPRTPRTEKGLVNYIYISKCVKDQQLRRVDSYILQPTARRSSNTPFTKADDELLIKECTAPGVKPGGEKIFKDIERRYPHHPWSGWKERWKRKLSHTHGLSKPVAETRPSARPLRFQDNTEKEVKNQQEKADSDSKSDEDDEEAAETSAAPTTRAGPRSKGQEKTTKVASVHSRESSTETVTPSQLQAESQMQPQTQLPDVMQDDRQREESLDIFHDAPEPDSQSEAEATQDVDGLLAMLGQGGTQENYADDDGDDDVDLTAPAERSADADADEDEDLPTSQELFHAAARKRPREPDGESSNKRRAVEEEEDEFMPSQQSQATNATDDATQLDHDVTPRNTPRKARMISVMACASPVSRFPQPVIPPEALVQRSPKKERKMIVISGLSPSSIAQHNQRKTLTDAGASPLRRGVKREVRMRKPLARIPDTSDSSSGDEVALRQQAKKKKGKSSNSTAPHPQHPEPAVEPVSDLWQTFSKVAFEMTTTLCDPSDAEFVSTLTDICQLLKQGFYASSGDIALARVYVEKKGQDKASRWWTAEDDKVLVDHGAKHRRVKAIEKNKATSAQDRLKFINAYTEI